MPGYAVVDLETTGLHPAHHHRIVEVAVVQVDDSGTVESEWTTLINPGRDLGPQHVHGVSAADVRNAPTFGDVAGDLAGLLQGRVLVAHNARFDLTFLQHEFAALGYDVPLAWPATLCTMAAGSRLHPSAPRTLVGACLHHGVVLDDAHQALADARAAANLLRLYLPHGPEIEEWRAATELAWSALWPPIPCTGAKPVLRGSSSQRSRHFLSRLTDERRGPWTTPVHEQYLAVLDRALIDRHLSAREHDELYDIAVRLGFGRADVDALHVGYFTALAATAWADGVLTDDETDQLRAVGRLLEIDADTARAAALAAKAAIHPLGTTTGSRREPASSAGFRLNVGDTVVFTGAMVIPRDTWVARAMAAGLVAGANVTKKTALVVAADPDSLSGKARKAADYGIPIVGEEAFARLLGSLN